MSDLPSSGDETWDGHLLELIAGIKDRKWHVVLMVLNRMGREALYRLNDSIDKKEKARGD